MAGSITSAMAAAQRGLGTFSRALAVVQENIANAATPGYARQRIALAPVVVVGTGAPQGVEVTGIQSMRAGLLDAQVSFARQRQAQLEKTTEFFALIEPSFSLDGGGVNDALDGFFAAAGALAVQPGDMNFRRLFRDAAEDFASSARSTETELSRQQANLEVEARGVVARINALAEEIAELQTKGQTGDPRFPQSGVETRLQQNLEELAGLVGFTTQRQNGGSLFVIAGSTPIVSGATTRGFSVADSNDGLRVFNDSGQDVTTSLEGQGGRLGAILQARNQTLPQVRHELNRLAKDVADRVNDQLARGVDLTGQPGQPLFAYNESAFTGTGRAAGTAGAATPAPPASVTVTFSNGLSGSITAALDSFAVGAAAPDPPAAGDRVVVRFVSADGAIEREISTAPLLGGESAAEIAQRLDDAVALDPELSGLVAFSVEGGRLKAVLSDAAGQGFDFTVETTGSGFATGLEPGGALGGQSAEEIAGALNAQVALQPALAAAGLRFAARGGEVRLDADVGFDFAIADADPAATGFASGLDGDAGRAGGAQAALTLRAADLPLSAIAAGSPGRTNSADNILAVQSLAERRSLDGLSYNQFFAALVNGVGQQSASASARLKTESSIVLAAENLRDSFTGVDINEETLELMRFEQGYQAMIRVIKILGELNDELFTLIR